VKKPRRRLRGDQAYLLLAGGGNVEPVDGVEEVAAEAPRDEIALDSVHERCPETTPAEWKLLIQFLAESVLRISECLALTWSSLDFGRRRVLVRRRLRDGSFGPPKSRYGRRDVQISTSVAQRLWSLRGTAADDARCSLRRPAATSTRRTCSRG
jgi:integrase